MNVQHVLRHVINAYGRCNSGTKTAQLTDYQHSSLPVVDTIIVGNNNGFKK